MLRNSSGSINFWYFEFKPAIQNKA